MKLTIAQKDAVVALLKQKIADKRKEAVAKYVTENRKTADKNVKAFLEQINKMKQLAEDYASIRKKMEEIIDAAFVKLSIPYLTNVCSDHPEIWNNYKEKFLYDSIRVPDEIKDPDYNVIRRDLEIASISTEFDVDKFLEKYL